MSAYPYSYRLIAGVLLVVSVVGCRHIRQAQQTIHSPVVTAPGGPVDTTSLVGIDVELETTPDVKLFKAIDPWMGVPYKYGGVTMAGVDCSGLVVNVMREARGISLRRSSVEMMEEIVPIEKEALQPGDLLFFKIGGISGFHVGIYTGKGRFVHASASKGVIMSSLDEPYYIRHYYASGRIK